MDIYEFRNINLSDIKLLTNRSIMIGSSDSGKTYFLANLLYQQLLESKEVFTLIFYVESLVDFDHIYKIIIYYTLRRKKIKINNKIPKNIIDLIEEFQFIKNISKEQLVYTKINSNVVINNVLNLFINRILKLLSDQTIDIEEENNIQKHTFLFFNRHQDFNNFINKLKTFEFVIEDVLDNRKTIRLINFFILFDDISVNTIKNIQHNVNMIYESGRHSKVSVNFIDQYIKSPKIPPLLRNSCKLIFFRSINKTDIIFIKDYLIDEIEDLGLKLQKLIKELYCLILYEGCMYKFKCPKSIYLMVCEKNKNIENDIS
jgi:hypothetical protein